MHQNRLRTGEQRHLADCNLSKYYNDNQAMDESVVDAENL